MVHSEGRLVLDGGTPCGIRAACAWAGGRVLGPMPSGPSTTTGAWAGSRDCEAGEGPSAGAVSSAWAVAFPGPLRRGAVALAPHTLTERRLRGLASVLASKPSSHRDRFTG